MNKSEEKEITETAKSDNNESLHNIPPDITPEMINEILKYNDLKYADKKGGVSMDNIMILIKTGNVNESIKIHRKKISMGQKLLYAYNL